MDSPSRDMATQCESHGPLTFSQAAHFEIRRHHRSQSVRKRESRGQMLVSDLQSRGLGIQGCGVVTGPRRSEREHKSTVSWGGTHSAFWTEWQQRQFRILADIPKRQQSPFSPLRPSRPLGYSSRKRPCFHPIRHNLAQVADYLKPHKAFLSLDGRRSVPLRTRSP